MNQGIDKYEVDNHFPSLVFRANESQFLSAVRPVFNEYVKKSKTSNKVQYALHPCTMSETISSDERIYSFVEYISNLSWDILNRQGYNMDLYYTNASEMWCQQHMYSSNMEQHIHGQEVQLCGFYFIDTPPESSKLVIHDPRSVKIFAGLPERKSEEVSFADNIIIYTPNEGDLIFTNSWLAHSFTRNASKLPYNFIHINIRVMLKSIVNAMTPLTQQPIVV